MEWVVKAMLNGLKKNYGIYLFYHDASQDLLHCFATFLPSVSSSIVPLSYPGANRKISLAHIVERMDSSLLPENLRK